MSSEVICVVPFQQPKNKCCVQIISIPQCLSRYCICELIEDVNNRYTGDVLDEISEKCYNLNLCLLTQRLLPIQRKQKEVLYRCLCELELLCEKIHGMVHVFDVWEQQCLC